MLIPWSYNNSICCPKPGPHQFPIVLANENHIPLDISFWSLFREKMLIEAKKRVGHIHAFTVEFILDMLKDHGFDIIDKMYTPPTYMHQSIKQKITHGIRNFLFFLNKKMASKTIGGYSIMVLTKNRA